MEITEQMKVLEGLYEQLLNAYVPAFKYELYYDGGCQLYAV